MRRREGICAYRPNTRTASQHTQYTVVTTAFSFFLSFPSRSLLFLSVSLVFLFPGSLPLVFPFNFVCIPLTTQWAFFSGPHIHLYCAAQFFPPLYAHPKAPKTTNFHLREIRREFALVRFTSLYSVVAEGDEFSSGANDTMQPQKKMLKERTVSVCWCGFTSSRADVSTAIEPHYSLSTNPDCHLDLLLVTFLESQFYRTLSLRSALIPIHEYCE